VRRTVRAILDRACAAASLSTILIVFAAPARASVTVSLTSPANGAVFPQQSENIQLTASTSTTQGYTVSKVEFFQGSTLIGTDTAAPYSITWMNVQAGSYALTAKATAIKKGSPDQTAVSAPVAVTVNAPPVVSLTSPVAGTTYPIPPPNIAVNAAASDSDGTITKVEFYDCTSNGQLLATVTTPPYSFTWTLPPPYWGAEGGFVSFNIYGVIAYATDNLGSIESSGCKVVFLAPTVTLVSPQNGASFTAPATIALNAAISPPDVPIGKMQFYNGTTLLGEAFSAPYSFNWQNVGVGAYSLTAKAVTALEEEWSSAQVNVTVSAASTQPQLYFIQVDHLNTPRLIADSTGTPVWRNDNTEPFGANPPDENPSGLGAFEFPLRDEGTYADKETNLLYNWHRYRDASGGRFIQADPIGFDAGDLSLYVLNKNNPLSYTDPRGLAADPYHTPGGPYHPPVGVKLRCTRFDSCPALRGKMFVLKRMIDSHQGWDWHNPPPRGGGAHAEDIDNLWRAYARCQSLYEEKCRQACPTPDVQSIAAGIGALGLGIACALNPLACGIGIGIGGAVGGGGLAPAQ
jgi:RHS repeat-associated protein